jgi:hypothetical protein
MDFAKIKLAAAAVLLACLALPEYTCSRFVGPDGQTVSAGPNGVPVAPYREVVEKHYPLESFSAQDFGSWLILLAFVWPWPILVYWRRSARSQGSLRKLVHFAEPPLALGSGYLIWLASSMGTRAAGAYLALAANAAYLGAWVTALLKRRRKSSRDVP